MQIKKIIEMGVLIEPAAAKTLNDMPEHQVNIIVERLNELDAKPLVLNMELVRKLTIPPPKAIKQLQRKKEFSMPELVAAWNTRFSILQSALMRKPELSRAVSIANAGGKCSVIGNVNITETKTEIEDPTGTVQIVLPAGVKVFEDDVIGVGGIVSQGVLHADDVVFPDIPMHQQKKADTSIGINMQADYILQPEECVAEWVDCNGIIVVLFRLDEETKEKFGANENLGHEILKRRHFSGAPFDLLEPVPDILFIIGAENFVLHYKGTTAIGVKARARIKMGDRTVEFAE